VAAFHMVQVYPCYDRAERGRNVANLNRESNSGQRPMVRAKGLEPPRAFAYQDLNLGGFVPSSPILYQGVQE
jgi:hypothetical protein